MRALAFLCLTLLSGCRAGVEVLDACLKVAKQADGVAPALKFADEAEFAGRAASKTSPEWRLLSAQVGEHVAGELAEVALEQALKEADAPGMQGRWRFSHIEEGMTLTGHTDRSYLGGGLYTFSGSFNAELSEKGRKAKLAYEISGVEIFGEKFMCSLVTAAKGRVVSASVAPMKVYMHSLSSNAAVDIEAQWQDIVYGMESELEASILENKHPCDALVVRTSTELQYVDDDGDVWREYR
jgi:hypothetical protein